METLLSEPTPPKLYVSLSSKLPAELKAQLILLAAEQGMNPSRLLSTLVRSAVNKTNEKKLEEEIAEKEIYTARCEQLEFHLKAEKRTNENLKLELQSASLELQRMKEYVPQVEEAFKIHKSRNEQHSEEISNLKTKIKNLETDKSDLEKKLALKAEQQRHAIQKITEALKAKPYLLADEVPNWAWKKLEEVFKSFDKDNYSS